MNKKILISLIVVVISIAIVVFFIFTQKTKELGENESNPNGLVFTEIKESDRISWDPENKEDLKKHITVKNKDGEEIPYDSVVKNISSKKDEKLIIITSKDEDGKEVSKTYNVKINKDSKVDQEEDSGNKAQKSDNGNENTIGPTTIESEYDDSITKPSKMPDGFTFKKNNDGYEHFYSYNQKLPGGGYINEVIVTKGEVLFHGKDNRNEYLSVSYSSVREIVQITMGMSHISSEDVSVFDEVGRLVTDAYGKQMVTPYPKKTK